MIKVVLLAAGKSTRTTSLKQLYKIDGEFLINIQIQKLLHYGFKVVVVLGHRYDEISDILNKEVEIIYNKEYEQGMFSSVQAVFKQTQAKQFLFCHTDRPIANKEVFLSLLQTTKEVSVAFCCKKKAPPIMMRMSVKEKILDTKHIQLNHWISDFKDIEYIKVNDERIHFNANSDEELKRYFNSYYFKKRILEI